MYFSYMIIFISDLVHLKHPNLSILPFAVLQEVWNSGLGSHPYCPLWPRIKYHIPNIWSAKVDARRASPSMTGQIGWFSPATVNPASVILDLNLSVLAWTFSANPELPRSKSKTWKMYWNVSIITTNMQCPGSWQLPHILWVLLPGNLKHHFRSLNHSCHCEMIM